MATIVLDPGHGGVDNGAVSFGRTEKHDNLTMAQAVASRLRARGQNVIMTRNTDIYVPLAERARISNNARADIFVSIHRNSFGSPAANGIENWVVPGANATTVRYAQIVLDSIVRLGCFANRGLRQGNFQVLRETLAPAMLLELGFISNPQDNAAFDRCFEGIAGAIAEGILTCLGIPLTPPPPAAPPSSANETARYIQRTLNERYGAGLTVDGIIGPLTRRALIRGLQTELNRNFGAGLAVDGIFGPLTKAAVRALRQPAQGNYVWILQALLFSHGHNLAIDGIFGPITTSRVMAFQASRGITADGVAGPVTFAELANRQV